jgi:hypothetical protein
MTIRIRRLVPLRLTPLTSRRLTTLACRLTALPPASLRASSTRAELEHLLMRLLAGAGLRGVDAAVRDLIRGGLPITLQNHEPGVRIWAGLLPQQKAELRVTVTASRLIRTTLVTWRAAHATVLSGHQRERTRIQNAFYSRYLAAGRKAYAPRPGRLPRPDRWVLLVGEFEADIQNGGFRQFLANKGRRRARAVLRVLDSIAVPRTAALLRHALRPSVPEPAWGRLDRQYDRTGEDLTVATMRHLGLVPSTD